ncbi:amidohydrolase [Candidatus Bathyarchaeota archaeon]|nr:amidohydrolase [Candidatus Bathyarchaeota archaeon]
MSPTNFADIVLINGKIVTINQKESVEEALAIKKNKIIRVGKINKIEKLVGEDTKVIDLKGKTVLPGFIDTHVHALGAGKLKLQEENEVDIKYANSINEVLELLRKKIDQISKDEWVIGWGYMWSRFKEKRAPTSKELDEISPNNPVLLKFSAYGSANSYALRIAGINKDSKPEYGEVELDPQTNQPTGILKGGAAIRLVSKHIPQIEISSIDAIRNACIQWSKWGITTIHQAGSIPEEVNAFMSLREKQELPVRIRLYVNNIAPNMDTLDHLLALGFKRGFGDNKIKLCGVKFALDSMGTMGTAATYLPCTGNPDNLGILLMDSETLKEYILKAHKAGLQTATHSIGDRAIDINLNAIEYALKEYPMSDHRHRIEHCTYCEKKQLDRIKKLGVHPAESNYVWNFGDAYKYQFGEERSKWLFPFKSFKEYGIIASSNSDYGGGPWHGNPIQGIYSLVTRKTEGGDIIGINQAISVIDAIKCYTINGAYASFDEENIGSLEEGKFADLIILSDDILTLDYEKIKNIQIITTIMDGKIVHQQ